VIADALATFHRELPGYFELHRGEWVAYHGSKLLGFSHQKDDLFNEWIGRNIQRSELLVRKVDEDSLMDSEFVDAAPDLF
jgi:hypothetical protein